MNVNYGFASGQLTLACFKSSVAPLSYPTLAPLSSTINRRRSPTSKNKPPVATPNPTKTLAPKFNILYITIDDLSAYLMPPNILPGSKVYHLYDALRTKLQSFTTFTNAYDQYTVCAPSRASFLSGRRPDNIQLYNFFSDSREKNPQVLTTYGIFKQAGYDTGTVGKVFHRAEPLLYSNELSRPSELLDEGNNECGQNKLYCPMPVTQMLDYKITSTAIARMQSLAKSEQPFLLGVGYHRGHYPHAAPSNVLPLVPIGYIPNLIPELTYTQFLQLWYSNTSVPDLPFDFNPRMFDNPNYYQSLAYYSAQKFGPAKVQNNQGQWVSISSLDPSFTNLYKQVQVATMVQYQTAAAIGVVNQIVRLLDYVDSSPLASNTVVIVHDDHGLSPYPQNNLLSKNTLFRRTARSPFYIRVPGVTKGDTNPYPVELVSVRATLCNLTGIDCNDNATDLPNDGIPFTNSIVDANIPPQPGYAITEYQKCMPIGSVQYNTCMNPLTSNGPTKKPNPFNCQMSYAIREMISGTLYELAVSYPFVTTYSFYGPVPSSPYAPYMQLYDTVPTWRIDYNNTGVVSTENPTFLFMYEYTAAAGGKNLLFSPSAQQARIRDKLLGDLKAEVDKYALPNRPRP